MDLDDELLTQFVSITSAPDTRARQYLQITDNNLEQAIQLYFESDGADLGGAVPSAPSQPQQHGQSSSREVVDLNSDEEEGGVAMPRVGASVEDDEAMARRMQEEMYGGSGPGAGGGDEGLGDVRAPMARTTETLADWRDDPDDMHSAVLDQLRARQQRPTTRPGIFNQHMPTNSVWDPSTSTNPTAHRAALSRATAGASDTSSKTTMLAEMYRPPFEILSPLTAWQDLRDAAKDAEKWLLVNVQDANVFDCQVLNRDVWKQAQVQETIRENFVFKQYAKDEAGAADYVRYYFPAVDSMDAYPHIAIVDPRTGEQVKVWSGAPAPKAMDFLMQLHEFLDRYSLKEDRKNPVQKRKVEKLDLERLSEEEQLQMAMQQSLEGGGLGVKGSDPDDLTRSVEMGRASAGPSTADTYTNGSTAANGLDATPPPAPQPPSPFTLIPSTKPHAEPPASPTTTRIQFRHPAGRVIRRFETTDPVQRLYEWLKAEPLEDRAEAPFELIFMGKNLMDDVQAGRSVDEAGLKNGSVMVEFVEEA